MQVKRSGGKIYGANLTSAEKKAMNIEIEKQLAEFTRKHQIEIDAIILWELHQQFGFGPERLRRFYENFAPVIQRLVAYYEMEDEDDVWLCTKLLKDYGIDIDKWFEEIYKDF